jgi:hypothetical protein
VRGYCVERVLHGDVSHDCKIFRKSAFVRGALRGRWQKSSACIGKYRVSVGWWARVLTLLTRLLAVTIGNHDAAKPDITCDLIHLGIYTLEVLSWFANLIGGVEACLHAQVSLSASTICVYPIDWSHVLMAGQETDVYYYVLLVLYRLKLLYFESLFPTEV